jgi:hypothetical protein
MDNELMREQIAVPAYLIVFIILDFPYRFLLTTVSLAVSAIIELCNSSSGCG